jgi:hypothetical protein
MIVFYAGPQYTAYSMRLDVDALRLLQHGAKLKYVHADRNKACDYSVEIPSAFSQRIDAV